MALDLGTMAEVTHGDALRTELLVVGFQCGIEGFPALDTAADMRIQLSHQTR